MISKNATRFAQPLRRHRAPRASLAIGAAFISLILVVQVEAGVIIDLLESEPSLSLYVGNALARPASQRFQQVTAPGVPFAQTLTDSLAGISDGYIYPEGTFASASVQASLLLRRDEGFLRISGNSSVSVVDTVSVANAAANLFVSFSITTDEPVLFILEATTAATVNRPDHNVSSYVELLQGQGDRLAAYSSGYTGIAGAGPSGIFSEILPAGAYYLVARSYNQPAVDLNLNSSASFEATLKTIPVSEVPNVPEPSTALFGSLLVGMLGLTRRRELSARRTETLSQL